MIKVHIVFEAETTGGGFRGAAEVLGVFTDAGAADALCQRRTNEIHADIESKLERGFYLRPETAFEHAPSVYVEAHELT